MRITGIRARVLYAELPAPMRSRGNVGYTEFFHTGSEYQRITAVELLTETEATGLTLLSGDARAWIEVVAVPALENADARGLRHCRRSLVESARTAPEELQPPSRVHIN